MQCMLSIPLTTGQHIVVLTNHDEEPMACWLNHNKYIEKTYYTEPCSVTIYACFAIGTNFH